MSNRPPCRDTHPSKLANDDQTLAEVAKAVYSLVDHVDLKLLDGHSPACIIENLYKGFEILPLSPRELVYMLCYLAVDFAGGVMEVSA
jgi:hypothetical protein